MREEDIKHIYTHTMRQAECGVPFILLTGAF